MKIERQFLLVIAASVFMGAALCAHAQERSAVQKAPDTGTNTQSIKWSGTIIDAAGKPVEGATVEYWRYEGNPFQPSEPEMVKKVTTGAGGAYEFQVSQENGFILARKAGLANGWKQFNQMYNPVRDKEEKIVLTPPGTLAGIVVDESGKPVANAEVSVAMALISSVGAEGARSFNYLTGKPLHDSYVTNTDAAGHFSIENFPTNAGAGFEVKLPGKALRPEAPESNNPETAGYRVGLKDAKLVVEPAGSIEGKVAFGEAIQPLPSLRLILQATEPSFYTIGAHAPVQANADGSFRFDGILSGSYRVMALFGTNTPADWAAEPVAVNVEIGKTARGIELMATRGGLLEAVVLGKVDRKPLEGFNISAFKSNFQAAGKSDSNGIARLRLLPGDYQVNAYHPSMAGNQASASVVAGKTNRVEIEITPPQKITGIVRAPDGKPAAGVSVRIIGSYGPNTSGVKTDTDGKFEMAMNSQRNGQNNETTCLLVRDTERNLAVAQDVDEETGPLDLKLAPALTLVGRAVCDGKPITNLTAALIFWHGRSGMWLRELTLTNEPGQYEIPTLPPGRKYGVVVSAPGYGQKSVYDIGSSAEAIRQELDPVELNLANLKLAGQVVDADDKPVAGCNVYLNGEGQPSGNTRTDREGRFAFDHVCEGAVQVSANSQQSYGNISTEGGDTNVVLRLGQTYGSSSDSKMHKLTGTVTDADGKPVAGAQLAVFPVNNSMNWVKSGTNGAYKLNWSLQSWQLQSGGAILVVRDTAHNLAATAELLEDATNLDVKLKPALAFAGQVKSADDKPLAGAQVGLWFKAGNNYNNLNDEMTTPDAEGYYEIKCLPQDAKYIVYATAAGHGRSQQQVEPDIETNRMELEPLVLKIANQILEGQVLNDSEKPVSGVNVSLNGEGQPDGNMTTDSKGRFHFKVCEGQVRLFASSQGGYGQVTAEAGDTNVVVTIGSQYSGGSRQTPPRAKLTGKPLPDLTGVNLASDVAPAEKPLLLCLFDAGQRPSRYFMRQLNEKVAALQQKNISVVGVQAAITSDDTFNDWKSSSKVTFPVGRVTEKSDKSKWASSVSTFPWLILTDAKHQVAAEGFSFDDLDAQIQKVTK